MLIREKNSIKNHPSFHSRINERSNWPGRIISTVRNYRPCTALFASHENAIKNGRTSNKLFLARRAFARLKSTISNVGSASFSAKVRHVAPEKMIMKKIQRRAAIVRFVQSIRSISRARRSYFININYPPISQELIIISLLITSRK